jgi:hypothetical protein
MILGAVRALSLLAAAMFLQGCELRVATEHPIGISAGSPTDLRLIGVWAFRDEGGDFVPKMNRTHNLVFIHREDSGGLSARMVQWDWDTGVAHWSNFEIVLGKLGETRFLNLRAREPADGPSTDRRAGKPPAYLPFLYRIKSNGDLELYNLDNDASAKAITEGRIAGTVPPPSKEGENQTGSEEDDSIRITADSPMLDRYFAVSAPALFSSYYATLLPVDRPAMETLTPLRSLRSLFGTIAVVSLPDVPSSTIEKDMVGGTQPGHITLRAARGIEARFQAELRKHPMQAMLRREVVAQARKISAATILDGGVAPTHWREHDYARFAEQGVRTVLVVGMESVTPVPNCFIEGCSRRDPAFKVTFQYVARLITVADRHVLWEHRYRGFTTGGIHEFVSTMTGADAASEATAIVRDVFCPGDQCQGT